MNKKVGVLFSGIILSLFLINFISATSLYEGIISVWNNIVQILEPIFSFLLGGDLTGGALFTKALIFTIILLLTWMGIKKINLFNENPTIQKILTVIVAILAIQGIGRGLIDLNAITLPYTATGVALSAGFPFLIYFFIINVGLNDQPNIVRRIAWIFFAVVFFGLVISKIGGLGNLFDSSTWGFYWIYIITALVAVAMAFLDGTIKGFFIKIEADKLENINKAEILAKLAKRKQSYEDARNWLTEKEYNDLMKRLRADAKRAGIKRKI